MRRVGVVVFRFGLGIELGFGFDRHCDLELALGRSRPGQR